MHLYSVVLAGGGGTRLWPLSHTHRPKPPLPLLGRATLLQETVGRLAPAIPGERLFIVANIGHVPAVADSVVLDMSTPHLDDIVRLSDDYGRTT